MWRSAQRLVGLLLLLRAPVASAQTGTSPDALVQPPELAAPQRASLVGQLGKLAVGPSDVERGIFSLPASISLPTERGEPLASIAPIYSAEQGVSEWGIGWGNNLLLTRFRLAGSLDWATDDLTGPFGRMVQGTDGAWYPVGLKSKVRLTWSGDTLTATMPDGTAMTFGGAVRWTHPTKGTYGWYLTDVQSVTNRKMHLEWVAGVGGRQYLSKLWYGGVGDDFQYRVELSYEALAQPFEDYRSEQRAALDRRVSRVTVLAKDASSGAFAERWHYDLGYQAEGLGPGFYLTSVQQVYALGERPPANRYTYNLAATQLANAALVQAPKANPLLAVVTDMLQSTRSTPMDIDQDGLADLEYSYDGSLYHQTDSGYTKEQLPPRAAGTPTACRPQPSSSNLPRNLARLRSGVGDETVYVASFLLSGNGGTTLFMACERDGRPYVIDASHPWTGALKGDWELGPTVRLVDLNRDHLPDLVRVDDGLVRILPNVSKAGAKQASSFAFGAERTMTITPAVTPDTAWVSDFNGDGLPDLVARSSGELVVWFGKGNFEFEKAGRIYRFFSKGSKGQEVDITNYAMTFLDANKDGLSDVLATADSQTLLFVNSGTVNSGTAAMNLVDVPGLKAVDWSMETPVFGDYLGTGNSVVITARKKSALALELDAPGTGLLASADDGRGTTMSFEYKRARPAAGSTQRQAVLSRVVATGSGETVTASFEYDGPYTHTVGKFLVGYGAVTRTTPLETALGQFLNDDRFAGVLLGTTTRDALVPGLEKYTRSTYAEVPFRGLALKRPATMEQGWRSTNGTTSPVAQTTTYEDWRQDICPARTRTVTGATTLVEETTYATLPAFSGAMACLASGLVKTGRHADPSLDFREELQIGLSEVGLPASISSMSGGAVLLLQTIGYDSSWRLQTLSSPGRGTTSIVWDGNNRLSRVAKPDGSWVEAASRDPLTDALTVMRSVRGANKYDQFFAFDGQERLQKAWDSLGGGSAAKPDLTLGYRWGTASLPAAITSRALVDADTASYQERMDLLDAQGEKLTTLARIPEGWSFGGLTRWMRSTGERVGLQRSPLTGGADPARLDYPSLYPGNAGEVSHVTSGPFGVPVASTTTFHLGIQQQLATSIALANGLVVQTVQENGKYTTQAAADAAGRTVERRDEIGTEWSFVYDAAGRIREVALPDGTRHRATYDGYGRIRRVVRDGVAIVEYAYNPNTGLLEARRFLTPGGAQVRTIAYAYDAAGRVVEERHVDLRSGATQSYRSYFDGATPDAATRADMPGLMTAVTGEGYEKRFEYRADGKLAKRTVTLGSWRRVETSFEYDRAASLRGRTVSVSIPGGATLATSGQRTTYDGVGRVSQNTLQGSLLGLSSYDATGLLGSVSFANGDAIAFTYDGLTRALTGVEQSTAALYAANRQRMMNARGLVDSETLQVGKTTLSRQYRYSDQGFLSSSSDGQKSWQYGFDLQGLPTSVSQDGAMTSIVRSGATLTAGSLVSVFDELGRTIQRGDVVMEYGPNGQVAMATRGKQRWSFVYDEAGQRLMKLANGVPVAAYLDEGYLDGEQLVEPLKVKGRTVGVVRNGVFESMTTDMLGTVMAEKDGTPRIASPFGKRDVHPGLAAAIDYVEKGYDADLGLVRMGVRDYDPEINRFTTPDPLFLDAPGKCVRNPVECNLYGYAAGNPLLFVDPNGQEIEVWSKEFWAGVAFGSTQAAAPGGFLVPSPAPQSPEFEAGRAVGMAATATTQGITGAMEMLGGGGLVAGGLATAEAGVGVAAIPVGVKIALTGAATITLAGVNGIEAVKAWNHAMAMDGQRSASSGASSGGAPSAAGDGIPRSTGAAKSIKFTKEMNSKAEVIARGEGIEKVETLKELFGGKTKDWSKMKTFTEFNQEVHYYQGPNGMKVGIKLAGEMDPF